MSLLPLLRNKKVLTLGTMISAFASIVGQGGKFTKQIRADNKVVIITGANTGIGKETARELAKRGACVYMACRDLEKCEQAKEEIILESNNKNIYCRELDLSSFESIRHFSKKFNSEVKRLDILINNAGVMRCPKKLTKDGLELQLGVNHMGHFLLTNLLLDKLKISSPSRVIVVSSLGHILGEINTDDLNSEKSYVRGKAYNQSKLANILFMRELAKRLEGTSVTCNALHPGVVHTELGRYMDDTKSLSGTLVRSVLGPFFKSAKEGAQTTIFAALDPELEKVTGKYFSDCQTKEVAKVAKDDKMAEWLWNISARITKLDTDNNDGNIHI